MLSTIEKNHGQWIDRDLWDYLKIYLKNKSQWKADLQINLCGKLGTTESKSNGSLTHDRVHNQLWVIYHMVSTIHFKCIPSAFLVKSFFSLFKYCECSTLKVRSRTFSSHRYNLNVLAVTYVVNTSFFFVRPTIKKNKITIIMNILNSNTNNE